MLKKRLIFSLLVSDGSFQLSRNFTLQKVGNLEWLYDCYNLAAITKSVDELVVLNVSRDPANSMDKYFDVIAKLAKNCFIPIALGGGIRSLDDAYRFMNNGADKLIVGNILFTNPELVKSIVSTFGGQSVVAAIDFRLLNGERKVFYDNGRTDARMDLASCLNYINTLGVGEIILTSIDKDGTGQGFDLPAYELASSITNLPIVATGGVGKFHHLQEGLQLPYISAVNTANIFNFMVNGLIDARKAVENSGIQLAHWEVL